MKISLENGEYEFIIEDTGEVRVDRFGERWWEVTEGAKAVVSLMHELERVTKQRDEARGIAEEAQVYGIENNVFDLEEAILPWQDYDEFMRDHGRG